MTKSKLRSLESLDDGTCRLLVEQHGKQVELVCRVVEGRGVKMVTSTPDHLNKLGLSPRKLAAAILAFMDAASADDAD